MIRFKASVRPSVQFCVASTTLKLVLHECPSIRISYPWLVPYTNTIHKLTMLTVALFLGAETGYFIAGGMAGMISRTATAPLDRLKVYLIAQTSPKKEAIQAVKEGAPLQVARHFGRPLFDACKELWQAGGIRSLFAGNGLNVVKVMPESAIKFGAYEAAKRTLASIDGSDPRHLSNTSQFIAGGFGGVVSQCVVYPLDTLKLCVALPFTYYHLMCSQPNAMRDSQRRPNRQLAHCSDRS